MSVIKFVVASHTYPANDPPIHDIVAGAKAGALPALAEARAEAAGGGAGLLRIAKKLVRGRSFAYRSYCGSEGLAGRVGCECDVGGAIARRSSACSRGMKPGSISVPPTARMEEAMVLRRSIGTYVPSQ